MMNTLYVLAVLGDELEGWKGRDGWMGFVVALHSWTMTETFLVCSCCTCGIVPHHDFDIEHPWINDYNPIHWLQPYFTHTQLNADQCDMAIHKMILGIAFYIIMHLSFIFLLFLLALSSFFRFRSSSSFCRICCCCLRLYISCDRASSSACSCRANITLYNSHLSNSSRKSCTNLTLGFLPFLELVMRFPPCNQRNHLLQASNEQTPNPQTSTQPRRHLLNAPIPPTAPAGTHDP